MRKFFVLEAASARAVMLRRPIPPMNAVNAYPLESRGTILVVEDDHDIRVSVRNVLEDEGYTVLTVTNGRSALDLLEHEAAVGDAPCLIILDLMLPVMDGWHFADRLREDPQLGKIPIVIMSAYEDPPPPPAAVGFVKKPVDTETLLQMIALHCP
jgi:CheY-like chemotaxis protein